VKLHVEGPKMLGATVKCLVAMANSRPGFEPPAPSSHLHLRSLPLLHSCILRTFETSLLHVTIFTRCR